MNIFKSIDEINKDENTVLTIGTFDGIHKGHKYLFDKLKLYSNRAPFTCPGFPYRSIL